MKPLPPPSLYNCMGFSRLRMIGIATWLGLASCTPLSSQEPAKNIPATVEGWSLRVEQALAKGKSEEALKEMDAAIEKQPKNSQMYIIRGSLKFRSHKIDASIEDFDRAIELNPENKPYLWQRGIALYYAGKFQESLDQFAIHREVNPNDVENAFWHFLCNVQLHGLEAAQKDVLLAGHDSRVPLMQVQKLIQGKITPEEVLEASEKGGAGPVGQKMSRFYGYLYVGLYYDALGDKEKSKEWIQKSIDTEVDGYMTDVARVHLEFLNREKK